MGGGKVKLRERPKRMKVWMTYWDGYVQFHLAKPRIDADGFTYSNNQLDVCADVAASLGLPVGELVRLRAPLEGEIKVKFVPKGKRK